MRIYIASDHAGFRIKQRLKNYLDNKYDIVDLGTDSTKSVDYPDYAKKVAKKVATEKNAKGILICGSGTGMVIAANKMKGIRAVAAYDAYSAKMSRKDNDANILALRGRYFPFEKIRKITNTWLNTSFSSLPKHKRRIKKIER